MSPTILIITSIPVLKLAVVRALATIPRGMWQTWHPSNLPAMPRRVLGRGVEPPASPIVLMGSDVDRSLWPHPDGVSLIIDLADDDDPAAIRAKLVTHMPPITMTQLLDAPPTPERTTTA